METELVTCPDCGKVIAPPGAVDSAVRCRCAEKRDRKVSPESVSSRPNISVPIDEIARSLEEPSSSSSSDDKEDTDTLDAESAAALTSTEKKCYVCGANLAGRVRLKDHLGRYWCKECAAADARAKKREDELRCADCSRVFPARKLQYFQTDRVCATCYKHREKALEKKIVKATAEKLHKSHEFSKLKWMAIIAVGLIVIATIFQLAR
jgi:hypothetical protein